MRWKSLVVGFGLVLVTVTACGGPGGSGSGGVPSGNPASPSGPPTSVPPSSPSPGPTTVPPPGPTSPPRSEPPSPPTPADRLPVAANQVDFSALPAGFPHEVWVSGDGKTLHVRAEEGGCGRATAEVREQSTHRVVVNLIETQSMPQGQMCPMIVRYPVVSAPLAEPLGQRQVVLSAEKRN